MVCNIFSDASHIALFGAFVSDSLCTLPSKDIHDTQLIDTTSELR